ncbi:MAG: hypothetical protein ABWZ25_17215 [Chitinophagaceae bacterium]
MSTVIVIDRNNTKALDALKKLREAKETVRNFVANGGNIKDFKVKKR